MAALAGLGPLGHFDLNFLGGKQVFPGHAEAAGGHLLDGGIEGRSEAGGQFAALAAVGAAAQTVHGLGHALVGLLGNGAVAHGPGAEAAHDAIRAFHFVQGDFPAGFKAEGEHGADGAGAFVFHPGGVPVEQRPVVRPHGLLQKMNGFGGIQVFFRPFPRAELMGAHAGQARGLGFTESGGVMETAVRLHLAQIRTAQNSGRIGKVPIHELPIQAHGLEKLGALVGLQGGHAHLGGDFQHPGGQRLVVSGNGAFGVFVDLSLFAQGTHAVMGQIGVHSPRPVGDEQRQLMGVSRFAALQNHGHRRALFDTDQMLFQGRYRKQRGNGQTVCVHPPVGQDQDIDPVPARLIAGGKERIQRLPQGLIASI